MIMTFRANQLDPFNLPRCTRSWNGFICRTCKETREMGSRACLVWHPDRSLSVFCEACRPAVPEWEKVPDTFTWRDINPKLSATTYDTVKGSKIFVKVLSGENKFQVVTDTGIKIGVGKSLDQSKGLAEVVYLKYQLNPYAKSFDQWLQEEFSCSDKNGDSVVPPGIVKIPTMKEIEMSKVVKEEKVTKTGKVQPAKTAKDVAVAKAPKEVKESTSTTDAELQAIVDGTLKVRAVKGNPKQGNLRETAENGMSKGRPLGITTGLPITAAWSYIFIQNEKAPKNKKMTDEQLSVWIKSEFPGRKTAAFDNVHGVRQNYNNGRFSRDVNPKLQSKRYDPQGNPMVGRVVAKKEAPAAKSAPAKSTAATPAVKTAATTAKPVAKAGTVATAVKPIPKAGAVSAAKPIPTTGKIAKV